MTADVNQERSTTWLPYPADQVDPLPYQDVMLDRRLDDLDEFLEGYFTAQLADQAAIAMLRDQFETMLRHRKVAPRRASDGSGSDVAA